MSELYQGVLTLVVSVLIASVSQILLKLSAQRPHASRLREYLNFHVMAGYGLLFVSTLLTLLALRTVPLSWAPVIESLGYVFVAVMGVIFLKEKIGPRKLAGMAFILAGVCIFSL